MIIWILSKDKKYYYAKHNPTIRADLNKNVYGGGWFSDIFEEAGDWIEETFIPEGVKDTISEIPVVGDAISRGFLSPIVQQFTDEGKEAATKDEGTAGIMGNLTDILGSVATGMAIPGLLGASGGALGTSFTLPGFGGGAGTNLFANLGIPGFGAGGMFNPTGVGGDTGGLMGILGNILGGGSGGGGGGTIWDTLLKTGGNVLSNILGGGGGSGGGGSGGGGGTTGVDWLDKLLGLGGAVAGGYLSGEQMEDYQNWIERLYQPQMDYQKAQLKSYEDVFSPLTKSLGGILGDEFSLDYSLTPELEESIWGKAKQRTLEGIETPYKELVQGASERFAGGGMLGQPVSEQFFSKLASEKVKTTERSLEDLAVERAMWEYGQKSTEKQNRVSNLLTFLGKTPSVSGYTTAPPYTGSAVDWSKLTDILG